MNTNNDIRELTILHSNDIHGNFLPRERDEVLYGGAAKLHQYIEDVREERKDKTMYVVAGDIFTGSTLDSESDGQYSIEIMNIIKPDVVTLGNHSADHGLGRIPFLERLADFDVINANLYLKGERLCKPYKEITINGIKILIIGVVTEMIMDRKEKDKDLNLIECKPPLEEIQSVCDSLKERLHEYDLRIILSHLGYESDQKLAKQLDKKYGIDLIIGGHSHTELKKSQIIPVNDIIIVQAGVKTKQIGRLDLEIDTSTHTIHKIKSWDWNLIQINSNTISKKPLTKAKVVKLDNKINKKMETAYSIPAETLLAKIPLTLTQDYRFAESNLGNFFADVFLQEFDLDIAMVGSGSIREEELGPNITFKSLIETFNLNKKYLQITMRGDQIKKAFEHFLEIAPYGKEDEGEYFQLSKGCKFHYDKDKEKDNEEDKENNKLTVFGWDEKEVLKKKNKPVEDNKKYSVVIEDNREYSVGIEEYHYNKFKKRFGINPEELPGKPKELTDFMFKTVWLHLEKNSEWYEKTTKEDYELEKRTLRF